MGKGGPRAAITWPGAWITYLRPPVVAHLIRLWAFLQKEIILLISKARGPLAPPGPACRVPSSILGKKSLAKGLPTLQLLPS